MGDAGWARAVKATMFLSPTLIAIGIATVFF
jgi:hypothetical protein